jgi:hypothetical protein
MNQFLNDVKSRKTKFSKHPFSDWLSCTIKTFGIWQGGPFPRFQCAGVANLDSIVQYLDGVVDVLCGLLDWIDGLEGKEMAKDIPIPVLKKKMENVLQDFNNVTRHEFQNFGVFRLGLFITLSIGASLLKPGRHIRQVFYPARGTASRNHMSNPLGGQMNNTQAKIPTLNQTNDHNLDKVSIKLEHFDTVMHIVCNQLGFTPEETFRDFLNAHYVKARIPGD